MGSTWIVLALGGVVIFAVLFMAKRWGAERARVKAQKAVIRAAEQRKAIDNEIQNLTPNELADRLRSGM